MNFDPWHHWMLLRPLFFVVLVAAFLGFAWLVGKCRAWRRIDRDKDDFVGYLPKAD